MGKLRTFFEYLVDNIFDIATIVAALYIVVSQQLQPSPTKDFSYLATWILGVLGLIAISGIWDRNRKLRRIEDVAKEGRDLILRRMTGKAYAKDFFLSDKSISRKTFESADVIYVSGMTLTRTTRTYAEIWEERLRAGATIKVMILELDNNLLKELILRSSGDTNVEYWKNKLQVVRSLIRNTAETPTNKGNLELGKLPYIPSYGITLIDPEKPNAHCFVELYHHESSKLNPTFELSRSSDPEWFSFFKEQFDTMWQSCQVESFQSKNGG